MVAALIGARFGSGHCDRVHDVLEDLCLQAIFSQDGLDLLDSFSRR